MGKSIALRWYGAAILGITMAAGSVGAATQGTLGATSNGSISISITVANRTQISNLTDVSFSAVDPGAAATNAQSDCVWSNTATKGYSITATGSGTSGAFTLANGSLSVPYSVQWAASTGQSSGTALTSGAALAGMTSTAANPTCSTSPSTTSSLIVGVASGDLQSMTSATAYTGTLSLLVAPQ